MLKSRRLAVGMGVSGDMLALGLPFVEEPWLLSRLRHDPLGVVRFGLVGEYGVAAGL